MVFYKVLYIKSICVLGMELDLVLVDLFYVCYWVKWLYFLFRIMSRDIECYYNMW